MATFHLLQLAGKDLGVFQIVDEKRLGNIYDRAAQDHFDVRRLIILRRSGNRASMKKVGRPDA
jgi:hypothetical protein